MLGIEEYGDRRGRIRGIVRRQSSQQRETSGSSVTTERQEVLRDGLMLNNLNAVELVDRFENVVDPAESRLRLPFVTFYARRFPDWGLQEFSPESEESERVLRITPEILGLRDGSVWFCSTVFTSSIRREGPLFHSFPHSDRVPESDAFVLETTATSVTSLGTSGLTCANTKFCVFGSDHL